MCQCLAISIHCGIKTPSVHPQTYRLWNCMSEEAIGNVAPTPLLPSRILHIIVTGLIFHVPSIHSRCKLHLRCPSVGSCLTVREYLALCTSRSGTSRSCARKRPTKSTTGEHGGSAARRRSWSTAARKCGRAGTRGATSPEPTAPGGRGAPLSPPPRQTAAAVPETVAARRGEREEIGRSKETEKVPE